MEITFAASALRLLPEGAAFDAARGVLYVSDLHLGKAAVFRDAGLALPEGPDASMLDRLASLVERTGARTLTVLGDVFHARSPGTARVVESLAAWRAARPEVTWTVVPGNHDRRVPWNDWLPGADVLREGDAHGPWRLAHHPPETAAAPVLCGHLHPGVTVGPARQRKVKLPCFWLRRSALVLPAFGDFTGMSMIARETGDQVWVTAGGKVTEVPAPGARNCRK
jgi:DNA ligase-associated metallophosphoesterase